MILPKILPEICFTKECKSSIAEFAGPVHMHFYYIYGWFYSCKMCINIEFWNSLPDTIKWFLALHEIYHITYAMVGSPPPGYSHDSNPEEWEADLYACRIFCAAGFDLEKLSQELQKYAGRRPYLPV